MLRRLFADLKLIEERSRFKIYKIPKKSKKTEFVKLDECEKQPKPISVANRPFVMKNPLLGSKRYYWCACGLSKNQPFCDSSHMKTAFKPVGFVIQEKTTEVFLCLCKNTSNPPYCDQKACGVDKQTNE